MPVTNVKLAGTVLPVQPSRVIPHAPPAVRYRGLNGKYKSFNTDGGWYYELQWGNAELADEDAVADLKALFDAMGDTIELEYTDVDGSTVTCDVLWDEELANPIHWGSIAERFSIMLYEAASGTRVVTPVGS